MKRVVEYTIEELCHELPMAQIASEDDYEFANVFFTSLGFEDRALTVPQRLQGKIERAFVFVPSTNRSDNQRNQAELKELLTQNGTVYEELSGGSVEIDVAIERVINSLGEGTESPIRCTVDISVMPSRFMIPLISRLLEIHCELKILYTMAADYKPSKEEFESNVDSFCSENCLTTEFGVEAIVPSIAHPGQHLDQLPACLVLFPNFRKQRSLAVISEVDESLIGAKSEQVVWFLTKPLDSSYDWRLEATRAVNNIDESSLCQTVDSIDYRQTILYLDHIYLRKWKTHNISISPLGTKMQRLGVALFNYCRPSTRLIYAHPVKYNSSKWSQGVGKTFVVDLGCTEELRRKLTQVGSLRVVER
jgi:hypothetical protein